MRVAVPSLILVRSIHLTTRVFADMDDTVVVLITDGCPRLEQLQLGPRTSGVTDDSLVALSVRCRRLQLLVLRGPSLSEEGAGLLFLCTLPLLRHLDLGDSARPGTLTDAALQHLARPVTDIAAAVREHAERMHGIAGLAAGAAATPASRAGAAGEHARAASVLARCFRSVMEGCELTEALPRPAATGASSSASVATFAPLTSSLTMLGLRKCELLTDAGMRALLHCSALQAIELRGCSRVTGTGTCVGPGLLLALRCRSVWLLSC